jgi:radical SAM superfamily enzyme YgiQ (UPF0313 family)
MEKILDIRLVCVEDGLDNTGFRKIAAFVKSIHSNTKVAYLPTANHRNLFGVLMEKGGGNLNDADIHRVAQFMAEGNIAAFSSMTQSATVVYKIIADIRYINPHSYIIWGGIHPIIQPEDAIKHADAVCTGEGEFAFKNFLDLYKNKKDFTTAPGFWFRKDNNVIKNRNLPLMTPKNMNELPIPMYQDGETVYRRGKGFEKISTSDFLDYCGLQYGTVWSIGCPLHCAYCSNTKFVEYDKAYRRIRHSSPRTIINEIKKAISKQPHLSTVAFHDDSFLSLPYAQLEEFAKLYKSEIKIPFVIYGVIPTYVREDKIALLLDAGMNRIRMGIQSGSENILEFYKRPTKLYRIKEATKILNKFKKYMIPPSYDIILENPIETPEDTRATVDMLYEMPRPFTLNIYALRIIPNTTMAKDIEDRGFKIPLINKSYFIDYHRTLGNIVVFALTFWKMPRWLYKYLRNKIYPVHTKQQHYPILFALVRTLYYVKRAFDHLRFMDFSVLPGKPGYFLWKLGIIKFWKKFVLKLYRLPEAKLR